MFNLVNTLTTLIKTQNPLILNLTNEVSVNFVANGLLSLGASPIMSRAPEEMADLLSFSSALVVNPGTLDSTFTALALEAGAIATEANKPIILDPVGCGASRLRTDMHRQFLASCNVTTIRGNASEIMALAGATITTKGVDSTAKGDDAITSAQQLSHQTGAVIVVSGETDVIVSKDNVIKVQRGSAIMPLVTGTGCLLTAVVGAFTAVTDNPLDAALAATYFYAVCGELAAEQSTSPGSFMVHFLDALHAKPLSQRYPTETETHESIVA